MYARNFAQGQRWIPGIIIEVTGPVSFLVRLLDGRVVRRHQDQLRIRKSDFEKQPELRPTSEDPGGTFIPETFLDSTQDTPDSVTAGSVPIEPDPVVELESSETAGTASEQVTPSETSKLPASDLPQASPPTQKTYPKRTRNKPNWFDGPRNP